MIHRYVPQRIDIACKRLPSRYTVSIPDTAGAEIGVSKVSVADNRRLAVFSCPRIKCLLWLGLGGGALAHAGSHGRRYANLTMCPATPIGVGGRDPHPVRGGCIMRQSLALPEQKQFPLSIAAGRNAAVLWLENPLMSAATWRDSRFAAHACGMGFTELAERRRAFNEAFEQSIADAIVGLVFVAVEVCHA
ncbi:hypothetical protein SAMD00023378_1307 [Ralstonia sp. NT80]|nr:hypothetical protein SAMD00023378_1307 [Ralstonia sp. NT80]